jgi:hypothetical protein
MTGCDTDHEASKRMALASGRPRDATRASALALRPVSGGSQWLSAAIALIENSLRRKNETRIGKWDLRPRPSCLPVALSYCLFPH